MPQTDGRPDILSFTSGSELRRWYWLKSELEAAARHYGVRATGGKFTILDRIAHRLDTGETVWPGDIRTKPTSKFDWHSAPLSPDTVITDSYKNSQNVRRFFRAHAGETFKFNIAFMDWMRTNAGQTLGDAVAEYHRQQDAAAQPGFQTRIADHNQFNQYTRDFLADNPDAGLDQVRRVWALKRALPSDNGRHVYDPGDLDLE